MNESPIVRARPSLFAGDRSQAPAHQLDFFVGLAFLVFLSLLILVGNHQLFLFLPQNLQF